MNTSPDFDRIDRINRIDRIDRIFRSSDLRKSALNRSHYPQSNSPKFVMSILIINKLRCAKMEFACGGMRSKHEFY